MKGHFHLMLSCLVAGLLFAAVVSGAQLSTRKALNLEVAKALAAAAEQHAVKNKWNVVIAILDDGGNLMYLQRMDGTQIGSVDVALAKAKSALLFKRPTKAFSDAVAGGRTAVIALPGALAIEGGLPIVVDGEVLGSIGVSGVTSEQDGMIGQAGIDALKSILGK
jgi:uncharacterized protein GlcG (DUF336 family)